MPLGARGNRGNGTVGTVDITDQQRIFRDSIGQKATVQREQASVEDAALLNRALADLGLEAQKLRSHLQHFRYLGSAAVHIFTNDVLGQLDIISQANPLVLYRCPEELAARALDDLIREMKQAYGRKHSKLRSGF